MKIDKISLFLVIVIIILVYFVSREALICASDPFQYGSREMEKNTGFEVKGRAELINKSNSTDMRVITFSKKGSYFQMYGGDWKPEFKITIEDIGKNLTLNYTSFNYTEKIEDIGIETQRMYSI